MSLLDDVLALVRQRVAVYIREAQVLMEKPPEIEHWDVTNSLRKLELNGLLASKRLGKERWYFDSNNKWESVESLVQQKAGLVRTYSAYEYGFESQPEGMWYDDYSEYFVEDALKKTGCIIFGKSTNYFDGRVYLSQGKTPGRPPDLDFIAGALNCKLFFGVSVKNMLDYPKPEAVEQLLDMCSQLRLRPLMVARMLSGVQVKRIHGVGGYTLMYKRWLLKPGMTRRVFNQISDAGKGESVLNLPVSIYRWIPDFMVVGMKRAIEGLSGAGSGLAG